MTFTRRPFLAMGAAAIAVGAGVAFGAAAGGFSGEWFGTLDLGSRQLRLRLVVADGPTATLYSLDQGGTPIPAGQTKIEGGKIFIAWPVINASFAGELTGGAIVGQFTQGGVLPLTFSRTQTSQSQAEPLTQAGLAKIRATAGAPAMAAAGLNRGGRRVAFADGLRAMGRSEPVTTRDVWHIGSCTKSITATLVARAVEAGLVRWEDSIGAVLGSAVPNMRAEYRDATYRHLLSHRSGLPGGIDLAELAKFPRERADAREDRIAFARLALSAAPKGAKETTFEYSNAGYIIAGAMLEAKLGAAWEQLVRKHVFEPLKLASAGFGAPGTPGAFDQPVGHAPSASGALEPYVPGAPVTDNPAVVGPAGRVHMSFDDLLTYLSAHCARSSFLSAPSWQVLHTPPFGGGYALGWERRGDTIWHNGSNTLWYCEMQADFTRGIVSAAAANDGRSTNAVGQALKGVAEAVV